MQDLLHGYHGTLKGVSEPWLRNSYDDARTKTFNIKADYTTTINGVHNISALIAYETSEFEGKGIDASRRYFISARLPYLFAGGAKLSYRNVDLKTKSYIEYQYQLMK